jgi:TatD DNase family protein
MFVDSHCHLDFPELAAELPSLLEAMAAARVTHALCISVTLPDWPAVHALALEHPNLYASVGVHPDNPDAQEPSIDDLAERSARPKVVAIGETGLDYYRADRRPRVATQPFSYPHTCRASRRKAAGDPHARRSSGHDRHHAR